MEHKSIPLSDCGHIQAEAIAGHLEVFPSLVLTSEHLRTQLTALPFCQKHQCTSITNPLLNEFSALSPETIAGMASAERRPIADTYWQEADINKRMGDGADTFDEFNQRVGLFKSGMANLSDQTVIFGHGIWFGLLVWKLMGFDVTDSVSMKTFRRFQTGLPLPNGVVYQLTSTNCLNWAVEINQYR